jgi:hypothetical protein
MSPRLQTSLFVLCSTRYAVFSNMFPLGIMALAIYDDCMNHHNHASFARDDGEQPISNPVAPLVSEMLSAFLDLPL